MGVAFAAHIISAVCVCPVEEEAALAEAFACGLGFPFPLGAAFFLGSLLALAFACEEEDLAEVEEVERPLPLFVAEGSRRGLLQSATTCFVDPSHSVGMLVKTLASFGQPESVMKSLQIGLGFPLLPPF